MAGEIQGKGIRNEKCLEALELRKREGEVECVSVYMFVCVCVCVCVCMFVYMYTSCVYVCKCICVCMSFCVCGGGGAFVTSWVWGFNIICIMCVYVIFVGMRECVCVCVCVCACMHALLYRPICIKVCVCVCVCVHECVTCVFMWRQPKRYKLWRISKRKLRMCAKGNGVGNKCFIYLYTCTLYMNVCVASEHHFTCMCNCTHIFLTLFVTHFYVYTVYLCLFVCECMTVNDKAINFLYWKKNIRKMKLLFF